MPIFDRKEFLPLGTMDPFGEFKTALVSAEIQEGAKVSSDYKRMVRQLPARQLVNFGRATRTVAASTATTVGIADYTLGSTAEDRFGKLGDLLDVDMGPIPAVVSNTIKTMVQEAGMVVFEQVADRILTKVPIVGWAARAALATVEIVRKIRSVGETNPPHEHVKAFAYRVRDDQTKVQEALDAVRAGGDLTRIFLPASLVSQVEAYSSKTEYSEEGIAVGTGEPGPHNGLTHVPGLADLGDAIQIPVYRGEGNQPIQKGVAMSWGNLHPSAAQLSLALWQAVIKNGPLAFQIDGDKIADAWEQYYYALLVWAMSGEGVWKQFRWMMVGQVATWAQYRDNVKQVHALGEYFPEQTEIHGRPPTPKCPADRICVPAEYVNWFGAPQNLQPRASRGGLVRYFIEEQWRAKLKYYLGTITCAYVPAGAPALAPAGLVGRHEGMRRLLLTHKARYKVDLSMVPDDGTGYRDDLVRAVMAAQTPGLAVAPPTDTPEPKIVKKLAIVLDDVPPVDPELEGASPDLAPNDPAVPGPSGDAGALVGLLLAAGAGALVLGTLKGVKR